MWWRKAQREDEPFFLSEDSMTMHGELYKKRRNLVKKYKKRWFVLSDNSFYLNYYSAPQGKLLGQIDINNILNVQAVEGSSKKFYGMQLTTSSKVYSLYARTVQERDNWCCGLTLRLRDIATTKISIREVVVAPGPVLQEDVHEQERNCQTFPKASSPHRHSNSHQRTGTIRDSPRRALSDGMLRSSNGRLARFTPSPLALENAMGNIQASPKGSPLKADTSLTLTGTSYILTENSLSSSRPSRNPIAISDDFQFSDTTTVIHNSTFDESIQGGLVRTPESSTTIDDAPQQQAQLLAKLNRMEHIVEEKDATIAALSAMLKRQSIIPDSVGKNRGVQQHLDEYVGISMWLEQRKKSELQKDVHQLREANDELSILLEEERQKCQYLEREKYNMQCMIEHLEREKIVSCLHALNLFVSATPRNEIFV
eukprot:Phypoly_transcript_08234.p1 GENE.Phypoly_transcript_08234~~Phypoly_transcript_08234.p1  ORF type:complete len:426 (+),score=60.52 Phypoly_transcript_08234:2-1279(+)